MRGVKFGEYHTADDWDLILNSKKINPPTPKIVKVTIDGRDGELDLSRALTGEMKYNDRDASFSFIVTEGKHDEREGLINRIVNLIHGQKLQIIEPDDVDHYLLGECSVSDVKNDKAYGSFSVKATCEPYRYSINEINRIITASATPVNIVLTNNGKRTLTPTVVVSDSVTLSFGNTTLTLGKGTYKLSSLQLKSGSNIVSVSGSGTITFTYREAVI